MLEGFTPTSVEEINNILKYGLKYEAQTGRYEYIAMKFHDSTIDLFKSIVNHKDFNEIILKTNKEDSYLYATTYGTISYEIYIGNVLIALEVGKETFSFFVTINEELIKIVEYVNDIELIIKMIKEYI